MIIKPLGDRVLVKPIEESEQVRGGIIIPETAKEKPQNGEIVAVGPGAVNEAGTVVPMHVAAGAKVLYSKYGGTEVTIDGDKMLIMREGDILGVIED
jgi:chaperonin GroES